MTTIHDWIESSQWRPRCGYVCEYSLDLLEKSFVMRVDVRDAGRLSTYDV
jgi:hypothetical protein